MAGIFLRRSGKPSQCLVGGGFAGLSESIHYITRWIARADLYVILLPLFSSGRRNQHSASGSLIGLLYCIWVVTGLHT